MKKTNRVPFLDFNGRLFYETFRRLKTIGIVALVIMCLSALLTPIGYALSTSYTDMMYETSSVSLFVSRELLTLMQAHPLVYLPMFTLAILLPLIAFSFLNKRCSSDFYHALPVSRAALFTANFAAVLSWIAVDLIISIGVSIVTTICFPSHLQLAWSSVLPTICAALAGSVLVAGCVTFAMCITGTVFTNLLVAALLFLTPRVLMWYISGILQNAVNILPDMMQLPILDITYNVPIDILWSGLTGDSVLNNWEGYAYSAAVGLAYAFGALAVFRTRRSETAEQPAPTPLLQTVYRLTVTFLVSLIPTYFIFVAARGENVLNTYESFGVFVLYVITAVTFCIYELVTTKKPKLLLKAAPTFLIVLLADVVLVIGLLLSLNSILAFRPTAAQVQSISFATEDDDNGNNAYYNALVSNIHITDPQAIRITVERLANAAENNSLYGEDYDNTQTHQTFDITFYTKLGKKTRQLGFTGADVFALQGILMDSTAYREAYQLPALTKETPVSIWCVEDNELVKSIYRTMCEEFKTLPFETRYRILQGSYDTNQAISATVSVGVVHNGKTYTLNIPLLAEYFPNAYNQYLQYVYEDETANRNVILSKMAQIETEGFELSFELYAPKYGYLAYACVDTSAMSNTLSYLLTEQLMPNLPDRAPSATDYILRINISTPKEVEYEDDYVLESHSAYFVIPANISQSGGIFFQICEEARLCEPGSADFSEVTDHTNPVLYE